MKCLGDLWREDHTLPTRAVHFRQELLGGIPDAAVTRGRCLGAIRATSNDIPCHVWRTESAGPSLDMTTRPVRLLTSVGLVLRPRRGIS
jgi:hypothetical protein